MGSGFRAKTCSHHSRRAEIFTPKIPLTQYEKGRKICEDRRKGIECKKKRKKTPEMLQKFKKVE